MTDPIFKAPLSIIDPAVDELIQFEKERQQRKLIMIPSESFAPPSVLESLSSPFQNLYAEGYPEEDTRIQREDEILDYAKQLTRFRRNSDPRYYKGVEYADIVEALARRRCAEVFQTERISADKLFVNVQPLSGAPANNAVYSALIEPGDTILGMNLLHGGHLTHGSSVNRSGKLYKAIHYSTDINTGKIDYDEIQRIATQEKPRVIIAGYSSYPWVPDWAAFREIADAVGAYLLTDISHIAGLIAARVIPSPVGYAHIITFTTHKTLCGPRGACILTADPSLSKKIDRAVFPGEQGGPHVQVFAALATAFLLAKTDPFKILQQQIIKNCSVLCEELKSRGLNIAYNGTDTHLLNIDCKTIVGSTGTALTGDMAARILDVAGIVVNPNTIPGDKTALKASGIRLGTPWLTQRGMGEKEMVEIANIIADIFKDTTPFSIETRTGQTVRAKVNFTTLEEAKDRVNTLSGRFRTSEDMYKNIYPHSFGMRDYENQENRKSVTFSIKGEKARQFVNYVFKGETDTLLFGDSAPVEINIEKNSFQGLLTCIDSVSFMCSVPFENAGIISAWLRSLSDGYINFDSDFLRRIPGPIIVEESDIQHPLNKMESALSIASQKPYFIGITQDDRGGKPEFTWNATSPEKPFRTALYDWHVQAQAKMVPFAGWEMPVWYSSVVEEHLAVRKAAGLFDVTHMGVFQAEGPDAVSFLDSVCGNDISALTIGESCYTHFLDPNADVLDDLLVYRHAPEKFLVVVNAANDDKDWAWLNAVKDGEVSIDKKHPHSRAFGANVILNNLRDPSLGAQMRVDIALQGPKSQEILLLMDWDKQTQADIKQLKRTQLKAVKLGDTDVIVSRTGYTGEKMAFEIFIHPQKGVELWKNLIERGSSLGLKPCGLGARDSLRTEAGLPLYGHEMSGPANLGVGDAGFGSYVKVYKPWFIGRDAFLSKEFNRSRIVSRFRFNEKRVRMAHYGDPVMDDKGKVIGFVTSCAIDTDEFLTGQACIEQKYNVENTPIFILQNANQQADISPRQLKHGDRVTLPALATVVSRFPKL